MRGQTGFSCHLLGVVCKHMSLPASVYSEVRKWGCGMACHPTARHPMILPRYSNVLRRQVCSSIHTKGGVCPATKIERDLNKGEKREREVLRAESFLREGAE